MTQSICFNHLTKRFDDKSAKWQKSWEFLPESFLLSEEVLEQLKLVDAMEEVSVFFLRNMRSDLVPRFSSMRTIHITEFLDVLHSSFSSL